MAVHTVLGLPTEASPRYDRMDVAKTEPLTERQTKRRRGPQRDQRQIIKQK